MRCPAGRTLLRLSYVHFDITSRRDRVHSIYDPLNVEAKLRPLLLTEHDDCDPAIRKILLIAQISVSCYEQAKADLFHCIEQIAISQPVPSCCDAVRTVCRSRWERMGTGVPWSNKIST